MPELPRISDAEWEVMRVLWARGEATAGEVAEEVRRDRTWSERTVKSLLSRLVKKRALGYEAEGNRYRYRPLVTEEECVREASRSFLDRVFGGTGASAVLAFVREADLTKEEREELLRLLEEEEEK